MRHSSGNSIRRLPIGNGLKLMSSTPSLALKSAAGISGWLRSPPAPRPSLEQDLRADVVIVGAGYNGLSAALELRTRGIDSVVLERDFAGSGASGRNAGYLASGSGLEFGLIISKLGRGGAEALVRFYDEAVRHVETLFARLNIKCDYTPSGIIAAAIHPAQESRVRHQVEIGRELGTPVRFLAQDEMRARGIPPAFLCGAFSEMGGTLDPGKYVLGLRQAALDAGVRLFENSAVTSIEDGAPVRVRTERGSVAADTCILATNAYSPALGFLSNKVIPIRVSAIETEPLTGRQREALGWPNREGIVTAHYVMESHRLTSRNTLLISTKRIDYPYSSVAREHPDSSAYAVLEAALRERLPEVGDVPVSYRWNGWVTFSGDTIPVVGNEGSHRNILYSSGCSGHGLATQTLMGVLLAERACGREHEWESIFRRKVPRLPPEPLRWTACKLLLGTARLLDGRVDRKARRRGTTWQKRFSL